MELSNMYFRVRLLSYASLFRDVRGAHNACRLLYPLEVRCSTKPLPIRLSSRLYHIQGYIFLLATIVATGTTSQKVVHTSCATKAMQGNRAI